MSNGQQVMEAKVIQAPASERAMSAMLAVEAAEGWRVSAMMASPIDHGKVFISLERAAQSVGQYERC